MMAWLLFVEAAGPEKFGGGGLRTWAREFALQAAAGPEKLGGGLRARRCGARSRWQLGPKTLGVVCRCQGGVAFCGRQQGLGKFGVVCRPGDVSGVILWGAGVARIRAFSPRCLR